MTRVLTAGAAIAGAAAALMTQAATAYQGGGPGASAENLGAPVAFTDLSRAAGLHFTHINGASPEKHLVETMGSGALFIDYDNDGLLDVFLVDGGSLADPKVAGRAQHRLFHNNGHGTFKDATAGSGIRQSGYGMGACAGDYDNDGLTDLYVTALGPNVLYKNRGNGRFADVSRVSGPSSDLWSASCAFADFDRDGDLDLFVTRYVDAGRDNNPTCGDVRRKLRVYCNPLVYKPLPSVVYRNDGNGRFIDATASTGVGAFRGNGLGVVITDYDDDRWPDVFVANDGVPNSLYHNEGNGTFTETGLLAGVAVAPDGRSRAGMGVDAGDYDGDGLFDLLVTNLWAETHSLFRNLGESLFGYATPESGIGPPTLPFVGFGALFLDYDNDTELDIAIVNGDVLDNTEALRAGSTHAQRRLLFQNLGNRRFREIGRHAGPGFSVENVGRGLAAGDIDNDGDLDLLVSNNGGPVELLVNVGRSLNRALLVRTIGSRSNRDGIGAKVSLTLGTRTFVREVKAGSGYLGQSDRRVHFGMGRAAAADRLQVRWPSGRIETVDNVAANQIITIREGEGITDHVPITR